MGDDAVGKEVQRTVRAHLDVIRALEAQRLDRDDAVAVLGVRGRHVTLDPETEVLRSDDDVGKLSVLALEVLGRTVHAVHLPVDPIEVEVAHPTVCQGLVHLEPDPLIDEPLAHLAFRPARTPHAVGGDRAVSIARTRVVRGANPPKRGRHLARSPFGVVCPEPFDSFMHRRGSRASHLGVQLVHAPHMGGLLFVWARSLVGTHARRSCAIPLLALRAAGQATHRLGARLPLLVADQRRRDELRRADLQLRYRQVAGRRQEAVFGGGAHLSAALAANAIHELRSGLDKALAPCGAGSRRRPTWT